MQYPNSDFNTYLISLCTDQSLVVERSKRFYAQNVNSLDHLRELISLNRFWSPIVWLDGHNKRVNFKAAYYLVLDLDDGQVSLDDALVKLKSEDFAAIVHTTTSHLRVKNGQPPCDRFRIIIPFSRPITTLAMYEFNTKIWIKKFSADVACGSGASAFRPAMAGSTVLYGANLVDPVNVPPIVPRKKSPYANSRQIPSWLEAKLHFGTPGQRHLGLFSVSATLSSFGFSEEETIDIVRQSPLWGQGTDDDSRRTARDGWTKGKQD